MNTLASTIKPMRLFAALLALITLIACTPPIPLPAPSPDLGQIAYVLDGDIFLRHLPDGVHPALSPDGTQLAYSALPDAGEIAPEGVKQAVAGRRIWLVSAAGDAEPRQLTADPAFGDESPLWSGDGSHILFARLDSENRASLWLIPAGGGEPDLVVDALSPISSWHGLVTQVDWTQLFDWHR